VSCKRVLFLFVCKSRASLIVVLNLFSIQ